jgi:hypothetical protein
LNFQHFPKKRQAWSFKSTDKTPLTRRCGIPRRAPCPAAKSFVSAELSSEAGRERDQKVPSFLWLSHWYRQQPFTPWAFVLLPHASLTPTTAVGSTLNSGFDF